jgi:hypothetical protein
MMIKKCQTKNPPATKGTAKVIKSLLVVASQIFRPFFLLLLAVKIYPLRIAVTKITIPIHTSSLTRAGPKYFFLHQNNEFLLFENKIDIGCPDNCCKPGNNSGQSAQRNKSGRTLHHGTDM